MRSLHATRYVTPLREGGSMPAIVEADDGGLHVLKFRGAGQGPKALVAEWLCGELARACGFCVPALHAVEVDAALGRNEPDPEIRDLLRASHGTNLALAYLSGAITHDPLAPPAPSAELASRVVWFDAFIRNVDRTARNPNLLWWRGDLWLIDHGAALYMHHAWNGSGADPRASFAAIRDHVLMPLASALTAAGAHVRAALAQADLRALLAALPDAWLVPEPGFADADAVRARYAEWFAGRLAAADAITEEAAHARSLVV